MKTYYFNSRPQFLYSVMGLLGLLVTSCGSYNNVSYDNDGIYDDGQPRRSQVAQNTTPSNGYREYFGSLQDDNVEIFTDVENYRTSDDSTQTAENRGYESGYSGWGSDTENVTINVYGNNWGYTPYYNFWYGPSWGWNSGWGWNNWYGPGLSVGWGWNNWYGPAYGYGYGWGYNNWYGNGWYGHHNHNNYVYNNGIRGVRNEMYGGRNTVGRSANTSGTRGATYATPRRSTINNSTRGTQYNTTRSNTVRTNTPTRSQNYTPTRSATRNNSYTPSSSSGRSYAPSSSGSRSYGGGGGSYGGGGGRSGGGGSRR